MNQDEIRVYGYRWVVLLIFALTQIGIQFFWSTFLPITGEAADFYGVTPLAIGTFSLMFMLVYLIISLPSSWVISNWGVRKGVGLGVVLMGVFGMLRGLFGQNYIIVLLCTVMLAVAQPFIINAITTMSARWFPVDERATATGLAMLAQLSGIMAGMVVTPLLTAAWGIRPTLLIYGVIAVVVCILFLAFYKEHPPTPPAWVEFKEEPPAMREGIKIFSRRRDAILLLLIFCGGMVSFNCVSTWIEQILAPRGFDSIQAGALGGAMLFGGIAGCVVLPLLSDKTAKRKLYLLIGPFAIIPGLLCIAFFDTLPGLLVAGGVLGCFQLGLGPIVMEAAANVCRPATEATTQGVLWMIGQGLSVAGILIMDAMRTTTGAMTPTIMLFAGLTFLNLIFTVFLDESRMVAN